LYGFTRVKALRGELKRSEIRGTTRFQLTTKEFVQQRPSHTYRIALENILGMTECDESFAKNTDALPTAGLYGGLPPGAKIYKIVATAVHLVLPSGVVEQEAVCFYTRLSAPFAKQMESLLTSSL